MSENDTPEIDIEELSSSQGTGTLVDVRQPAEYAEAHVPGAVLIPMAELTDRMSEIDKNSPVFVICAMGGRSSAMTDLLRASGFDAVSVAGGTNAWIQSGRPVEAGLA